MSTVVDNSVAIRPKPQKGGRVFSDAEYIPARVDIAVGGSNNVHALSAALTRRWTCVGAKYNTDDYISVPIINHKCCEAARAL